MHSLGCARWRRSRSLRPTPRPIIDKLNREDVHILSEPDVREKFNQTGNFAVTSTPEEFAVFIRSEAAR
jgi:tripartite-type tricarboxylate transporter receptor subunit TctC